MINLYRKPFILALLSGFLLFSVNSAAQVFSGGVAPTMCVDNPSYVTLSDIVISELAPTDFTGISGTPGSIIIEPTSSSGFEFEPGVGSVLFEGEGSATVIAGINVTATTIEVILSGDNANELGPLLNTITISGIRVRAINSAASLLLERVNPAGPIVINGFAVGDDISSSSLVSDDPPSTAEAGPTQNVCGTSTTLDADAPVIGTGQWSFISNPDGLGLITDINDRQSDFSGTHGLTYVLQWTVSNGVCAPTTDVVTINFNLSPPSIDTQPIASQSACEGTNVTLSVTAAGAGPLSYQWFQGAVPVGTNSPVLTLSNVTTASAGTYTVQVTGSCSPAVTSSNSVLTINTNTIVTSDPTDKIVCVGTPVTFSGTATGTGLTYIWQVDAGGGFVDISGETNPNYTFTALLAANNNRYRLKVSGTCGTVYTIPARLTVNPQATANAGGDGTTCEGSPFVFSNQSAPLATASNYASLLWTFTGGTGTLFNANSLSPVYYPTANETGTITFTLTAFSLSGCINATDQMNLVITPAPEVEAGSDAQICEGTATFNFNTRSVLATAANGSLLWEHNGSGSFVDPTQLNPVYNVHTDDTGNIITFTLKVTSGSPLVCSGVQDQFTLRVNPAAVVTIPGGDFTVCEPANFELTGNLSGDASTGSWSIISATATGSLSVSSITGGSIVQASYTRLPAEINTTLVFRLTSDDPDASGPCSAAHADVSVTIDESAKISAGPDLNVCEYNPVPLNSTLAGKTTSVLWTGGVAGQIDAPTSTSTNYHLNASEVSTTNLVYTFTVTTNDPPGVCPAVSDNVIVRIIDRIDPDDIAIIGLPTVLAENDDPQAMTGLPGGGVFSGDAVSGNTFYPNIAHITPLINTVNYSVTDGYGCVSVHSQNVIVNPITDVDFRVENEMAHPSGVSVVCANQGDLILIELPDVDIPNITAPEQVVFSSTDLPPGSIYYDAIGTKSYMLRSDNLVAGTYTITYHYTNQSGATNPFSRPIRIAAAPKSVIDLNSICENATATFTESSYVILPNPAGAVIDQWIWDYGDGDGSTLRNPTHDYAPGTYNVKLKVITNEGCVNESAKVIDVGSKPDMKFDWTDFCSGNYTNFVDQTIVTVGTIVTYTWDFGDGYTLSGPAGGTIPAGTNDNLTTGIFDDPQHRYVNAGQEYNVTLSVQTDVGCTESVSRTAFILEYETLSPIDGYFEDFESGNGSWFANRIDKLTPTDTSWVLGIPNGAIINTPAPGGDQSWWTGANINAIADYSTYYNNEQSAVIGPCHDLTKLKRPMISFDYWSDSEQGSDGAVLQYSTNGGINWQTIGNNDGAGINWYNGQAITSKPGGQTLGQYGWTGEQTSGWKTAHYNLNEIDDAMLSKVIFRIAFGSNSDNTVRSLPRNGFAFDNIYIGEKRRTVLVEYFTNAGVNPVLNTYFDNLYDNQFIIQDSSDFYKIQYHIDRPSIDQINLDNPADPAARSSFYGVSDSPSGIMDGILGDYYGKQFTVGNYLQIDEEELDRRALEMPLFEMKIDTLDAPSDVIKMNIEVKYVHPTIAFNETVTVYAALVQDNVGSQRNVLRKFLLGPGGFTLTNVNWNFNHTEVIPVESVIDVPIGVDNANLHLVAFIQNRKTDPTQNRIHQTVIRKASTKSQTIITGTDDPILAQVKDISVYPNPATRYVNFATEAALTHSYQYSIVDQRGIEVLSGNLNRDLTMPQQVDLSNIADGVYVVMIHQNGRRLVQRKLAVLKR